MVLLILQFNCGLQTLSELTRLCKNTISSSFKSKQGDAVIFHTLYINTVI